MEQKLTTQQSNKLELQHTISPNIIHSLEILQYNNLELTQKIENELQENPLLEIEQTTTSDMNIKNIENFNDEQTKKNKDDESFNFDMSETELDENYDDGRDIGYYAQSDINNESDSATEVIENVLTYEKTLQEHLIEQLNFLNLTELERTIAITIISSIDDNGFLKDSITNIAGYFQVDISIVEKILKIIQSLDPPGIGAMSAKESLLLQLERKQLTNTLAYKIINEYYELFIRRKYDKLMKELNIENNELMKADNIIRTLHPNPAQGFGTIQEDIYIYPDVTFRKVNEIWIIIINDEYIPKLKINRTLYNNYKNSKDYKIKSFVKEKFNSAIWLIKSINQRNTTIYKICQEILEYQIVFFETGDIKKLKPFTLKNIAEKLKIHEATISRAISNKYADTPWGVFNFKKFFSTGYENQINGQITARTSLLEQIKEFINNEDKSNPLSDTEIWKIFKNNGINLKRRTITKYREEAGFLPKHIRRIIK